MRTAQITRNTLETQISVKLDLDGTGKGLFNTGVPFLDHMLDQIARHGIIDISIEAAGDLHIDAHHTVEDIDIALGQALAQAVGDKKVCGATVMLTFRWTKPCRAWCSIYPVAPASNIGSNLPALP